MPDRRHPHSHLANGEKAPDETIAWLEHCFPAARSPPPEGTINRNVGGQGRSQTADTRIFSPTRARDTGFQLSLPAPYYLRRPSFGRLNDSGAPQTEPNLSERLEEQGGLVCSQPFATLGLDLIAKRAE